MENRENNLIDDSKAESSSSLIESTKDRALLDEENEPLNGASFPITIDQLSKILEKYRTRLNGDDDLKEIQDLGEEAGILQKLKTDKKAGITMIAKRSDSFGENKFFEKPVPHFCHYVVESLEDTMLQILIVAAVVQIVLGATLSDEPERDWVDGISILLAVIVVVTVGSITNWKKELQFKALSDEQEKDTKFYVVRNGVTTPVQSNEILVGDILTINYGMILPVDALLVEGNNVKSDESSLTGESKELKKMRYRDCVDKKIEAMKEGRNLATCTLPSPVLLSGTNVISGNGIAVVIAVGKHSQKGQIRELIENSQEDSQTPLAAKLEDIAEIIGYFGMIASVITLVALSIRLVISHLNKVKAYNDAANLKNLLASYVQNFPDEFKNQRLMYTIKSKITNPKLLLGGEILSIILLCVSIIVVAIPEGLPLAVTLALAFSIKKMMDKQNLVRRMHACETMGGANIICTDKTGTLTKNEMTIVKIFDNDKEIDLKELNSQGAQSKILIEDSEDQVQRPKAPQKDAYKNYFSEKYYNMLKASIGTNVSASVQHLDEIDKEGKRELIKDSNKTDYAFITLLHLLGNTITEIREKYHENTNEVKQIPFNSKNKRMTTLIASSEFPTGYRLFTKGGADFVLRNATKYLVPDTCEVKVLDMQKREECERKMIDFNEETLRTLCVCYRDITKEDYDNFQSGEDDDPSIDRHDLVLVGIFGIKDILRPTVPHAVEQCHKAGVNVIMVTGDNLYTAVAIGKDCNIIDKDIDEERIEKEVPGQITDEEKESHLKEILDSKPYALTGNSFYHIIGGLICSTCGLEAENQCKCARTSEEAEQKGIKEVRNDTIKDMEAFKKITENLKILARSQPIHKYSLVLGLKSLKNVVAVTGDGTNDAPALSRSDVGFSMGKAGTDIAKEASDIIILDDDFSSIVVAILWGRNIYDNIRKFLQFQLTVNLCACILVFLCACIGNETPLIPIQMLWVNLIMDSLGSLALATESPYEELLYRKPTKRNESIINGIMWKHIIIQATVQLVILLYLYLRAPYFIKEDNLVRLAESSIIKHCYGVMPGGTKLGYIIHGSSAKWSSDIKLKFGMTALNCGDYAEKQDLSMAYKLYNSCNNGTVHMTVVFNVFVFYTLFNQINSRLVDDSLNIFKRIFTNFWFPMIFLIEAFLQVIIVEFGKSVFHTSALSGNQWWICIGFSVITFAIRVMTVFIPLDKPIQKYLDKRLESEGEEKEDS